MYSSRYAQPYYTSGYHAYPTQPPPGYYYDSSPKHKRRATADGGYASYQPPPGVYYYYTVPDDTKPKRSSSHRHREHVSSGDRHQSHSKRYSYVYAAAGHTPYRSGEHYTSHQAYARPVPGDDYQTAYERKYRTTPPPFPGASHAFQPGPYADHGRPQYTEHHRSEHKPRERRASYAQPPRPPPCRRPTAQDAGREGIPAGYDMKHWDPDEDPILLSGSVFDANSLGKWIYDWSVCCHGSKHPITEMAGDLWLNLISLAAKMKRAERDKDRIRRKDDREMIEDYLDSGDRLWDKINRLLKIGEKAMTKHLKKSERKKAKLTPESGPMFIKSTFGRDFELDRTEKIMAGLRLWNKRFDVNCEDILREVAE